MTGRNQQKPILVVGLSIGLVLVAALIVVWVFLSPSSGLRETKNCDELDSGDVAELSSPHFLLPRSETNLGFAWTFDDPSVPYEDRTRLNWETIGGESGTQIDSKRPADIEPSDYLGVAMTKLVNKGNSRAIPEAQVGYIALATSDAVEVQLCVDARGVPPGVYGAALEFTDSNVRAAPIAVQMTVPYSDERVPLTFFIIGALIALGLVVLRAWGTNDIPVYGLVFALVVAILVAVTEVGPLEVKSVPGWGARTQDFVTLTIATVLAVLGASALGEILPDLREGPKTSHDKETRDAESDPEVEHRVE